MRLTIWSLAAVACVTAAVLAAEGDWPKWLGPNGDGISQEKGLLDKWPDAGLTKAWTAKVGIGFAAPVAVGGKVYVFSMVDKKDTLTCLDADKGDVVWQESGAAGFSGQYPGTRATPVVEGEFIYAYGGNSDLVCRELATGKQVWSVNVIKETGAKANLTWGVSSTPVLVGDNVLVQSGSGGPIAVAVNKKTGKVAWQSEAKGLGSYAAIAPADGGKQLIVFAGKGIIGMDPAGKTLWTHPWETSWDVNAATPVVRGENVFLTSGYNHGCIMLKVADGKMEKVWEKKREANSKFVPPILDGDYLYVNAENPLVCLHWPDGAVKWKSNDPGLGVGGSFVRTGDKLVTLTETGTLELIQATPEGCKVISKMKMFSGSENWTMPLIYKGRIYVKGKAELVCLEAKAAK